MGGLTGTWGLTLTINHDRTLELGHLLLVEGSDLIVLGNFLGVVGNGNDMQEADGSLEQLFLDSLFVPHSHFALAVA